MKNRYFLVIGILGATLALASGDRLKSPVRIGQGTAATEQLVFDEGLGAGNPFMQSTSGGVLQLTTDGTHLLTAPAKTGTITTLENAQTFTASQTFTGKATATTLAGTSPAGDFGNSGGSNPVNSILWGSNTAALKGVMGYENAAGPFLGESFYIGSDNQYRYSGTNWPSMIEFLPSNGNVDIFSSTGGGTLNNVWTPTLSASFNGSGASITTALTVSKSGGNASLTVQNSSSSSSNSQIEANNVANSSNATLTSGSSGAQPELDMSGPSTTAGPKISLTNTTNGSNLVLFAGSAANTPRIGTTTNDGLYLESNSIATAFINSAGGFELQQSGASGNVPFACTTETVTGGSPLTHNCSAGSSASILTGGGCYGGSSTLQITRPVLSGSKPIGWECDVVPSGTVTVYAICCSY